MIDFDAYYKHRKKGFLVVVGVPAWWDFQRKRVPPNAVHVMRCGLTEGPMDALPREMQDVLLAWNDALVTADEERRAATAARREAERREPAHAMAGLDSKGEPW